MKLSYDSTLDDVVETATRSFLRSAAYKTNRWRGAVLCAVVFGVLGFLGFHSSQNINLPAICAIAAAWGAGLYLFGYKTSVRRRIAKYVATEMKGPWPRTTELEITDGKLINTTGGATTTYSLADLTSVNEDPRFIELSFTTKGLCLIPLRAFDDTDEKNAFLTSMEPTPDV
ncbi:MAG: YcxB family protein [Rariglobus sp.]